LDFTQIETSPTLPKKGFSSAQEMQGHFVASGLCPQPLSIAFLDMSVTIHTRRLCKTKKWDAH
jgi:hypothetical protein